MVRVVRTVGELRALVGMPIGVSNWCTVTQAMVDEFAALTGDHEWIHVDVDRASRGPFGTTIVHGYLTLAMLPRFVGQALDLQITDETLNYGLDRVRFTRPVPVGSNIRSHVTLVDVTDHRSGWTVRLRHDVEVENRPGLACIADTMLLIVSQGLASS